MASTKLYATHVYCQVSTRLIDVPLPISTARPRPRRLPLPDRRQITSTMENVGVLRQWFERVDSNHTGNITALQLQVLFPFCSSFPLYQNPNLFLLFPPFFSCPNLTLALKFSPSTCFGSKIADQRALADGNLDFPLSIVQQMIRFSS